jgi:diketogulonate reductase-like aldo/keto reductase
MEELYKAGRIKAIGISNFKKNQIEQLLESANIVPMVNQIEFHPGAYNQQIVDYCSENQIVIES